MRKRLFWWEAAGFLWTCGGGTLLHFVYEWSGENVLVAAFSAVNESTWEHMKLLFFAILPFSVVQVCIMGRNYPNILAVRTLSVIVGLVMIPTLFYTYTGALGIAVSWVNIAIFYASAVLAFLLDFLLLRRGSLNKPWQQVAGLLILWALAFTFVWCTFRPLPFPLWQDPVTGQLGI